MSTHNYDIVFLGGLFPKETEWEIINNSIGPIDNAANNLQWNLVRGLDEHLKCPVKIINTLYVGSYPQKYKKLIINDYNFSHSLGSTDMNVGFINLTIVKHISRLLSVKPYLKKWNLDNDKKPKIIIAYALTNIFAYLLSFVKKMNPDIITLIVVPDLPQYSDTTNNNGFIFRILKAISIKHILNNIKNIDGFVLLTKHMASALKLNNKKITVIEGISDSLTDYVESTNRISKDIVTIVYTGTLNERYGIVNLVKAFMEIDDCNYRLILCGAGDSEQIISDALRYDNRIIFMGQLQRDEIIDIQKNATILINPRQNIEEFTKYSFPSKNIEYLSSGRPVIAYKLDGIPDEYDNYMFFVPDNSIYSLTKKIIEVCSYSKEFLTSFGTEAKNWVFKEKNYTVQSAKIINMISDMLGSNHDT